MILQKSRKNSFAAKTWLTIKTLLLINFPFFFNCSLTTSSSRASRSHRPLSPMASSNNERDIWNNSNFPQESYRRSSQVDPAESLVMDMSAESSNYITNIHGDNYTDNLRNSSYAILNGSVMEHQSMVVMPNTQQQQPENRYNSQYQAPYYKQSYPQRSSASSGAASLPYMSRSISVDSYSAERKANRTCELEEYARRYEALQRGSSSRRRKTHDQKRKQLEERQQSEMQNGDDKPPLDKGRPTPSKNVWQSDPPNGRDSVSTVLSNSSSETVRYQESVNDSIYYAMKPTESKENALMHSFRRNSAIYTNEHRSQPKSISEFAFQEPVSNDAYGPYASLNYMNQYSGARDLKRFPLQTYASTNRTREAGADIYSNVKSTSTIKKKCRGKSVDETALSKSVPNLADGTDDNKPVSSYSNEDANYSFLDPEKKHKVPDNTLKKIQKQALLDYFERHNNSNTNNNGKVSNDHDSGFYSPTQSGTSHDASPSSPADKAVKKDHRASVGSLLDNFATGCRSSVSSAGSSKRTNDKEQEMKEVGTVRPNLYLGHGFAIWCTYYIYFFFVLFLL